VTRLSKELQAHKKFYDENGYLVTPVLGPTECDRLLELLMRHTDSDYSAQMNLDRKLPELKIVMRDTRVISIIKALQSNAVLGTLISQILYKKAGTPYASQAWQPHQDNSYPQAPYGAMLTINIFLERADRENGCLYLFPGSHKEPLLEFTPTPSYREPTGTNPGNLVNVPPQYKKIDIMAEKGDMLVLHGHIIHGSYANTSDHRSRPLFSITYCNKDAPFLKGKNANREWEEIG